MDDCAAQGFRDCTAGLTAISGSNFSGRSAFLRKLANIDGPYSSETPDRVYLSPEPENSLSGLSLSAAQELILHRGNEEFAAALGDIWSLLGLDPLLHRTPSTLSGGELTKLVVASAILLKPDLLAIDGTLEQLDLQVKHELVACLQKGFDAIRIVLADNRLSEIRVQANALPAVSGQAPPADSLCTSIFPSPTIEPSRLSIEDIHFRYPGNPAPILSGLSVDLEPGHVYFLNGVNGAGKSTLAKLLCGVVRPQSGEILSDGVSYTPWTAGNRLVSYHFQNPDRGRVRQQLKDELLAGIGYFKGRVTASDGKRCEEIAKAFGLSRLSGVSLDVMPYVIRKRAGLAAALAPEMPWYFIDEPTLGQDDSSVEALGQMFGALARQGAGVIIITHSQILPSILSGKQLHLRNGQLKCTK